MKHSFPNLAECASTQACAQVGAAAGPRRVGLRGARERAGAGRARRRNGCACRQCDGRPGRPHCPVSRRSGRGHPAGIDQPVADRAGRPLAGKAQDRPQAADRRQVGRRRQDAAELPRSREDDEQRPRLDQRAGRGGGGRPGRSARRCAELPAPRTGRGQPEVRRQAGGQGREGDHHHRAGQSRGDLCAAIHPEHGSHLWRGAGLWLLPGPVPVVLLPLSARSRTRHGLDLGCGHRCGVERRPLGRRLQRR